MEKLPALHRVVKADQTLHLLHRRWRMETLLAMFYVFGVRLLPCSLLPKRKHVVNDVNGWLMVGYVCFSFMVLQWMVSHREAVIKLRTADRLVTVASPIRPMQAETLASLCLGLTLQRWEPR